MPTITRVLLNTGNFVAHWWVAILIAIAVALFFLYEYFRSDEGKIMWNTVSLKIPVIGKLFQKLYVTRFSESLAVLVKGGIPITQAIEISAHAIGSTVYADSLLRVAESVRAGELLSVALSRENRYFPPIVGQMVAIGEKTGKIEAMFDRIAKFYNREIDGLVSNLVELIQPTLMVVLGVLVGLLFAAILIPIYNLVQVF
ncbi:MAG: type II secretion system F family protein [Candidatus Paceibacterota bacterium]